MQSLSWLHEQPYIENWKVEDAHIDHYGHVNNQAYLAQLEALAWAHTNALGLTLDDYRHLDRAMVIRRHELNYHLPSHLGDELACATWITSCDNKLSLTRQFQFICRRRQQTVFSATTGFVCTSLNNGAPKRMPPVFIQVYGQACI